MNFESNLTVSRAAHCDSILILDSGEAMLFFHCSNSWDFIMKLRIFIATIIASASLAGTAYAEAGIDAPDTPATDIHGAPGNTPGFGGSSANPDGGGKNGGDGIHMIDHAPGQDGEVAPGELGGPSNDMHGGLDGTTGRGGDSSNGNSGR
jgi:hypothetical protein